MQCHFSETLFICSRIALLLYSTVLNNIANEFQVLFFFVQNLILIHKRGLPFKLMICETYLKEEGFYHGVYNNFFLNSGIRQYVIFKLKDRSWIYKYNNPIIRYKYLRCEVACRKGLTHSQTNKVEETQQFILPLSRIQTYDPIVHALDCR
jgi:hypothetical protein